MNKRQLRSTTRIFLSAILLAFGAHQLSAEPYLDDRSTPERLVRSYFNAINLRDFARAWTYWGQAGIPDQTYDDFRNGFDRTAHIDLAMGEPYSEGAAGTIYHALPVAIAAWHAGNVNPVYYSGCFFLRMSQPGIKDPPVEGLRIFAADMEEVDVPHFEALIDNCAP